MFCVYICDVVSQDQLRKLM